MNLADDLRLAAERLGIASDRLTHHGVTADDMKAIGAYVEALAEHGHHVCTKALYAVENADAGHPIRDIPTGTDLQAAVAHTADMFGAAIHFAFEVEQAANAMTKGDASS